MQLAREPATFDLLTLDHTPQRVTLNPVGKLDCDRRPLGELLGQSKFGVREARIAAAMVVREHDPDRAVSREQRHVEPGHRTKLAGDLLHDLRVVEHRVDTLAPSAREHSARLRSSREHRVQQRRRVVRGDRLDPQPFGGR